MNQKNDISGIDDIKLMVDEFYAKVHNDELLAPIFNFRLSTYWVPHLEKMYKFWNAALFGVREYTGNPFMAHATMGLDSIHFERWLRLFNETVDQHFSGPVASDAKSRALAMADMFKNRLTIMKDKNFRPL